MSEKAVSYVDLKCHNPSEQQKKQRPKNTRDKGVNATEMSEQAVIYVDLKFQTPSKQQKKKTPKNTRDKGADFISPLATSHWIGLSRDKTDRPWMWVNGTAFSTDQFVVKKGYVDGNCALVTGGELYSGPCKESKLYICEQLVLLPKPDISA
ncbi:hypothetical protein KIL84_018633 [Mauremys mutica]|uniref:C-type lectin domain-containing protein n=1 Tax=Mauremys mutica TaxID=74926 RepID=A0A9D3XSA7_9SAUR|nr:hypothetical protein KIL84_018633 [Mauremys mutica]